jgi:DNA topoisomerase I (EC 5.99.1.2)
VLVFDGFLKAYREENNKDAEKTVPAVDKGELLDLVNLTPSQHFTRPPARYTESSLVKALEEKGIGRPSTYAPIVHTLLMRNYIRREKRIPLYARSWG